MNVHWISKGNVLGWFYELWKVVTISLDLQQKAVLHEKFQSEDLQLPLAYLGDIFKALNVLKLKNYKGKTFYAPQHHLTFHDQT